MIRFLSFLLLASSLFALDNGVTVYNTTGSTITNAPVWHGRVFARGEITQDCVEPFIGGVAVTVWQCQKVNEWPDGSLKFVRVAYEVSSLAAGASTRVLFRGTNSTDSGQGAVSKATVEGWTWEADMRFTYNTGTADEITVTRDMRDMFAELTDGASCTIGTETSTNRKLYQEFTGPVMTMWIVQDLCDSLAYDFGYQWDGTKWVVPGATPENWESIHPYFVLTAFKRAEAVKATFVVENPWTRKWQNQTYRQRFRAGAAYGTTVDEQTVDFQHTVGSVIRFDEWATAATTPEVITDPNLPYLVHSKAIPAFVTEAIGNNTDSTHMIPSVAITTVSGLRSSCLGTYNGSPEKPQYCRASNSCGRQNVNACMFWTKIGSQGGSSHELGMISTYYTRWLYAARNPDITIANKLTYWNDVVLGMAYAGATMPGFMRESRSAATFCNTTSAFDGTRCADTTNRTANEFGRGPSINAHDEYVIGPPWTPAFNSTPTGGSVTYKNLWAIDYAHMIQPHYFPALLTADPVWLDLNLRWGLHNTAHGGQANTTMYSRNTKMGYMGWGAGSATRWQAWRIRNITGAITLTSDGPEKELMEFVLKNTAAVEEGYLNITDADGALQYNAASTSAWYYGNNTIRKKDAAGGTITNFDNPLGIWEHRIYGQSSIIIHLQDSYDATRVNSANAPWMVGYGMAAMAFYTDQGYDWFKPIMAYAPRLTMRHLEVNPYTARDFNYPTHRRTAASRKEITAIEKLSSTELQFTVAGHGYFWSTSGANLTSIVDSGTVATVTFPSAHGLKAGENIRVSGVPGLASNVNRAIAATPTTTTLTFSTGASVTDGTYSSDLSVWVATVQICCADASWANGWAKLDTNDNESTYSAGTNTITITAATADTFNATLANWSTVSGTYPACCDITGDYKLYVVKYTAGITDDDGPFQTWEEFDAAIHPRNRSYASWTPLSSYRVFERWGSYTDIATSMMANVIDHVPSLRTRAEAIYDWLVANNLNYEMAFSGDETISACNGGLTPTNTYCGNMTWMVRKRHVIEGVNTSVTTNSVTVTFTKPTSDAARVAVALASTGFPDSDDSSDTAATCTGMSCTATVSGLVSGTNYVARISGGPMGGTTQYLVTGITTDGGPPPIEITTTTVASCEAGAAYSVPLTAIGGTAPYAWTVTAGALPSGVTLSGGGTLSGTCPASAATYNFTVEAEDADTNTDTQDLSIEVTAPATPTITTSTLANGAEGVAYSQTLAATGGTSPYTWAVFSGTLPGGLSLNSSTGEISGTPSAYGVFNLTFQVTDDASQTGNRLLPITVISADEIRRSKVSAGTVQGILK